MWYKVIRLEWFTTIFDPWRILFCLEYFRFYLMWWCLYLQENLFHQQLKSAKALHAERLITNWATNTNNGKFLLNFLLQFQGLAILTNLNGKLKRNLLSGSANTLKICSNDYYFTMSFENLHSINACAIQLWWLGV